MQSGKVVESGPVDQILNNAQNPYTQRLLEDVPKFWAAVERSTQGHVSEHA
jgi:ABC-type dipeptide/oligopeptide/nickel transport system ATPase component